MRTHSAWCTQWWRLSISALGSWGTGNHRKCNILINFTHYKEREGRGGGSWVGGEGRQETCAKCMRTIWQSAVVHIFYTSSFLWAAHANREWGGRVSCWQLLINYSFFFDGAPSPPPLFRLSHISSTLRFFMSCNFYLPYLHVSRAPLSRAHFIWINYSQGERGGVGTFNWNTFCINNNNQTLLFVVVVLRLHNLPSKW